MTSRHLQEVLGFYPFELVRGWELGGAQVLREEVKIYDRAIQSTVSPVVQKGVLKGVVVALRDITEQKQLEERKEEFVSIVSHELRTPLTSISGAIDLVLNGIAGETNLKQQRYLAMARESTDKLNSIVDDLLDLTKYSKGKLQMNLELTQLDELLRTTLEKYGPPLLKKRIRVTESLPDKPLRVLADPTRLGQVFNNVLTNAVKFTPQNGEIRVELKENVCAPGYAMVSVWNSGERINESDVERIFEKFEQARTVRTRNVQGTGLGLAICRSIVEAHGGRIWSDSLEVGARFVIVLPIEPQVALAPGADSPTDSPARPALAIPSTILVVEDEPEVAFVLKAMMLPHGHRVFIANDADEALVLARRHRPEVIVLDIRLPQIDGLELANIFRHDPETRHSAILAMSGADERERALRQGASAYLQKPLFADKLVTTINSLIARKSLRREDRVLVVDDDEKFELFVTRYSPILGLTYTRPAH